MCGVLLASVPRENTNKELESILVDVKECTSQQLFYFWLLDRILDIASSNYNSLRPLWMVLFLT